MIMAGPRVEDRMSDLPDELLVHILSYLDLTTAVRLSTLCRRWKHLWTMLPSLDFTKHCYPSSLSKEEATKRAMSMISKVLLHNKVEPFTAVSLYLPFYRRYHAGFLGWCISIAVERGVSRLAILLDGCTNLYVVPQYLSGKFNSLTELHLSSCALSLPEYSNYGFGCLKSLHISNIDLTGEVLETLTSSSSCPLLEVLKLSHCNTYVPSVVFISNPSIKQLHIFVRVCGLEKLVIRAPHVTHLKLFGAWRRYLVMDLSAAVEASLDFHGVPFMFLGGRSGDFVSFLNPFLTSFPSSAELHLSPWFLEVLLITKSKGWVAPTIRAKKVILDTGPDFSDIPGLVFFFNPPWIEHLTINMFSKIHLNKKLCDDDCHCVEVGSCTQGANDAVKKYCMLFDQSLRANHNLKTIVLNGFYKECGTINAENYCSYVRRSWQFELARIVLLKLKKLEKMVLKGSSIQPEISSLIVEMCCSLPKAVSTTIIECCDVKGA